MTPVTDWRRWITIVAAFGISGILGGGLIGVFANWLLTDPTWGIAYLPVNGLLVVCFAIPLWWFVVRDERTGSLWGAVIAGTIPVYITVLASVILLGSGSQPVDETMYTAALFQLLQLPSTLLLAVTGALVETDVLTWNHVD